MSGWGLRVAGSHDPLTPLGRVLGAIEVSNDGFIDVPGFATGAPFWTSTPVQGLARFQAAVSRSGLRLSWSYLPGANRTPCLIVYGVHSGGAPAGAIAGGRWGFRVKNPATGSVQIDDRYANYALVAKVTTNAMREGNLQVASVEVTASAPVVVVRSEAAVILRRVSRSGSTWRYDYFVSGPTGAELTFYAFDRPIAPTTPGWGLRVRSPETGAVTYDSRLKYLRVAGIVSAASYGDTFPVASYPAGRTYAVGPCKFSGLIDQEYQPESASTDRWISIYSAEGLAVRMDGSNLGASVTSLALDMTPIDNPPPDWTADHRSYAMLVADVTDL